MITMMEHPKHGRHPAMGHEVEVLKEQGWIVMPPKGELQKAEMTAPDEPVQTEAPTKRITSRNKNKG